MSISVETLALAKKYADSLIGNIPVALDEIIEIQETYISGDEGEPLTEVTT